MDAVMSAITDERWTAAFLEAMHPIAHLLDDPSITNVMLNPPLTREGTHGRVYVKTVDGKLVRTELTLEVDVAVKMLRRVIDPDERIELNATNPELSCRAGPYRLEGSIEPVVNGAAFTIRKHTHSRRTLEEYVSATAISKAQASWLRSQIRCGATVLVGGATDSGKTTLLNALVQVAAEDGKRILTIEDTAELMRPNELAIQFFTNRSSFTTRDAVRAAMRHNPQWIVVGEVRDGAAALEALKAWRTGHPGLATLHAGDCEEMLERMLDLCEEERRTRPEMIARSINICVHIAAPQGLREITIEQVTGFDRDERRFLLERIGGQSCE
jgi:type IV secretion system protein TrbB